MANKYRLAANVYDREKTNEQIAPKKIYFISVEGVDTEVEYLQGLSDFRSKLGINALVNIEVLTRHQKDGRSAPDQVIELLEEYLALRENGDDIFPDIPEEIKQEFSPEFIRMYLNTPKKIISKERANFERKLRKLGYDLLYRKYLAKYNNESDQFCILIDRDNGCHSTDDMKFIVQYCKDSNYQCFISSPCFELWLLLHFSDVIEEYSDRLNEIKKNLKISDKHTFVSNELSIKAHHGKKGIAFERKYLPHVTDAIDRASKLASDNESLIEEIGCNIWKLIKEMQSYNK